MCDGCRLRGVLDAYTVMNITDAADSNTATDGSRTAVDPTRGYANNANKLACNSANITHRFPGVEVRVTGGLEHYGRERARPQLLKGPAGENSPTTQYRCESKYRCHHSEGQPNPGNPVSLKALPVEAIVLSVCLLLGCARIGGKRGLKGWINHAAS